MILSVEDARSGWIIMRPPRHRKCRGGGIKWCGDFCQSAQWIWSKMVRFRHWLL